MANELKVLEGMDVVALARKHSDQATVSGQIIPWQTSLSFDPSVDSDSTVTKDGNVATRSSASTDLEVEFLNNTAAIADVMYDSLFDGELLDFWILYRKRKNAEGKYLAWYMQVTVQEDSSDNDPDDHSTRDVTFSVNGTPKRGWTTQLRNRLITYSLGLARSLILMLPVVAQFGIRPLIRVLMLLTLHQRAELVLEHNSIRGLSSVA